MGLVLMITGDHRAKALAFDEALGLDEVFYEQQPEDKARLIAALKTSGARVACAGDGVNDGPALMVADVGIAMPRAADIVLLEERLDALAELREIAQATMRLIHSNFRVAVGANSAVLVRSLLAGRELGAHPVVGGVEAPSNPARATSPPSGRGSDGRRSPPAVGSPSVPAWPIPAALAAGPGATPGRTSRTGRRMAS